MKASTTKKEPALRWLNMRTIPKSDGSISLLGSDGKQYVGHYERGVLFSKAPGWVHYTGWRRTTNIGVKTRCKKT